MKTLMTTMTLGVLLALMVAMPASGSLRGHRFASRPIRQCDNSDFTISGQTEHIVQLNVGKAKLFSVHCKWDQKSAFMIVDTGSAVTVLDRDFAEAIGATWYQPPGQVKTKKLERHQYDFSSKCQIPKMTIGTKVIDKWEAIEFDARYVNGILGYFGDAPVVGILGADLLVHLNAKIDLEARIIRIR